jgi:hypothetical protein
MSAPSSTNDQPMREEGRITRAIERQTSKIPSDVFLLAAGLAMAVSGAIQLIGVRRMRRSTRLPLFILGRRIELLAPMLLMLGVYNKLVKLHGR